MAVMGKIQQLIHRFRTEKNTLPTKIHLTLDDEAELAQLTSETVGDSLLQKLFIDGPRKAFPKIHGLTVIWDATETKVE